jgi:hypothetical protein
MFLEKVSESKPLVLLGPFTVDFNLHQLRFFRSLCWLLLHYKGNKGEVVVVPVLFVTEHYAMKAY